MMEDKKKSFFKLVSAPVLLVLLVVLLATILFAYIADEVVLENEKAFDQSVFGFFASISSPALVSIMKVVTFFGSTAFLLPAYFILVVCYCVKKRYALAIVIATIAVSGNLLFAGLKLVFRRHRPDLPLIPGVTDYSFPSGHSLSAFLFYSVLIYITWQLNIRPALKWLLSVLCFTMAIAIGISRIVLRVHYPTDVIGAFCLGIIWVSISFWVVRKFDNRAT